MKIKNVVCAPGRTGFYFDDQRAIKRGAGHDGMFYIGQPVTEGFSAVRQAGEAISVMLILEDGQVAYGDCAAVQYSGAGGRDPLFWRRILFLLLSSTSNRVWSARKRTISVRLPQGWKPSRSAASGCIRRSAMVFLRRCLTPLQRRAGA